MRDINGNINGTVYDKSTTIILGGENYKDSHIEKEKISIKKIMIDKIIEAILGGILAFITTSLGNFLSSSKSTNLHSYMFLILLVILFICAIGAFVLLVGFVFDIVHIMQLTRNGKFVEFESKKDMVNKVINTSRSNKVKSRLRSVGKVYKNIDGNIFRVKSKKCPFCESEPIGKMHLIRDVDCGEYIWVCSEQTSHITTFDYKHNF